jgi:hypothetical protein
MHCGPVGLFSSLHIAHAAPHIVALMDGSFWVEFDRRIIVHKAWQNDLD